MWDIPRLRDALDRLLAGAHSFPDFEIEQELPAVGRRNLILGGRFINHLKMILLAVDDVTENKLAQQALRQSEEHLRQSQKMEAVGRLAGGIAHDFNNLVTAIVGYSDLLQDSLQGNAPAIAQVAEIKIAGERAASLTQQLLAFSRRQVLQPKVLDLNAILADFDKMLRHLVGEHINISVQLAPDLWQVRADPGEIGRAVMNLWLNARDAMPDGGLLYMQTANLTLVERDLQGLGLPPGRYVTMSVRDTGIGMDPEMQPISSSRSSPPRRPGRGRGWVWLRCWVL
jgi:signal transduction histidine kinase